jgi:hypothetical protein
MAHLHKLSDETRASLTRQIGERLSDDRQAITASVDRESIAPSEKIELGEDFQVWTLNPDASKNLDSSLSSLATPTGYWYHLIRRGGRVREFASSKAEALAGDQRVHSVFTSPIAGQIDRAIEWVDQNDTTDATVRLLFIPYCGLHAFWLLEDGGDRIVIVDMPGQPGKLQYRRFYQTREFLELLSEQPSVGKFPPQDSK